MMRYLRSFISVVVIAIFCALLGIGIGFIQGAIVARSGATDEQLVFAGTAAMIGGLVALPLGPLLYYALKRRASLQQVSYVVCFSLLAGVVAAVLLTLRPNGPGWMSMYVTPLAAILLTLSLRDKTRGKEPT
jgi:hypothetical protein